MLALGLLSQALSGCYLVKYFKRSASDGAEPQQATGGVVLGQSLGPTAGGPNDAALANVYAVATTHAPAAVRPDPDLYVRNLLREYRPESDTVARQTGLVEQFRPLLGGATQDFSTPPQATYDATSLLAVSTVTTTVCIGLVAPQGWQYQGWTTILPNPPDQEQANILWLAQRFMGKPSAKIDSDALAELTAIMTAEEPFLSQYDWAKNNDNAKYVPVCAALALSAEALYL